jgi:hypothetical protein
MEEAPTYTAFLDETLIASGPLDATLPIVKASFDRDAGALVLIFEDQTGRQVDFDLRGPLNEVLERALPARPAATRSGPGRPKLGVVSREVSLLPRHWDWLEQQPNGASAALRRLVDEARNRNPGEQRVRLATEAVGRFLSAMAGNLPGYEEASRALYAGNRARVEDLIRHWPADIRTYLMRRLDDALGPAATLPERG